MTNLSKRSSRPHITCLATLLSAEEVADWVRHALQLHEEVVSRFEAAKITGYDFPELLEGDGRLLESHLGLGGAYERRRVQRGMRMKLMGMGRPPLKPFAVAAKSRGCSSIVVEWKSDAQDASFPIHKFVLQRRQSTQTRRRRWWGLFSSSGNSSAEGHWRTVYEGMETRFEETGLATDEVYSYRIVAWNVIGRSEYEYVSERTVTSPCAVSGSWLWGLYGILERLVQFLLAAVALIASVSRLSGSSEGSSNSVLRPFIYLSERLTGLFGEREPPIRRMSSSADVYDEPVIAGLASHTDPRSQPDPGNQWVPNGKLCCVCSGSFSKKDRWLQRHTCSSCQRRFHSKCGVSTHLPFLPCPVQGGCLCNNCKGTNE